MQRMKVMTIVWGIMIFAITGTLTFIGITYNKKLSDYQSYEKDIAKYSAIYVADKDLFQDDEKEIKINIKDLYKAKYLDRLSVNGNKCKGYVIVTKEETEYNYEVFIDCGKYQTEGFKDGKK